MSKKENKPLTDPNKNDHQTLPQPPRNYNGLKPNLMALIMLIALVLAILALIESAYIGSKLNQQTHQLNSFKTERTTKLNQIQTQQTQQATQLNTLQKQIQQNTDSIKQTNNLLKQWQSQKPAIEEKVTLLKLHLLLQLADYQLKFKHAPQSALTILKQAQKVIGSLKEKNASALNSIIDPIVNQLNTVPNIDVANILTQLNTLQQRIVTLPLQLSLNSDNTSSKEKQKLAASASGWRYYWNQAITALEKVVVVRRQTNTSPPLISPKQRIFLAEQIQTQINRAGSALLNRNQAIFSLSLKTAINWLNQYYDMQNANTMQIVNQLKALQKLDLQPTLPDLSPALILTTRLIKESDNG